MKDLIGQYEEALQCAKAVASNRAWDYSFDETPENFNRRRIANGMVADMREMANWAKLGCDPRTMYADNRLDAFSMDPYVIDSILVQPTPEYLIDDLMFVEYDRQSEETQRLENYSRIDSALEGLTDNEKTAFVLRNAERVTLAEIAVAMGVTVSSVRVYIRRAESKIRDNISTLFAAS